MSDLVDPFTGELLDLPSHRAGEQLVSSRGNRTTRRRWGGRTLLSNVAALLNGTPQTPPLPNTPPLARTRATLVNTQDLGYPRAIDVQMRFALNASATNTPILPFSPVWPFVSPPSGFLRVVLRRGLETTASVSQETLDILAFPEQFPRDILVERDLGIDVELVGAGFAATSIWVEIVATPVHVPAFRDQLRGWNRNRTITNFFAAVASPANVTLLAANPARVQFFIVNTSTNADMIIDFGAGLGGASWVVPTGTIVLPRNAFNSYESPIGGFSGGPITASWTAAPTGGALVTEGSYF